MYTTKFYNFEYVLPCTKSCSSYVGQKKGMEIKGSACVYNIVDSHNDVISYGAFDEYLESLKSIGGKNKLPYMYLEHKPSKATGKWFSIHDTGDELKVSGVLYSVDVIQKVLTREIDSLSIGFYIQDAEIKNDVRFIKKAYLIEVSIVSKPANPKAFFTSKESLDSLESTFLC